MEQPSTVGDRLREARQWVKGLTARELSTIADLGETHVGMIERGNVKTPSGVVLAKLSSVLGVSMDWLVSGRGKKPSKSVIIASVGRARRAHASKLAATGS